MLGSSEAVRSIAGAKWHLTYNLGVWVMTVTVLSEVFVILLISSKCHEYSVLQKVTATSSPVIPSLPNMIILCC